MKSINSKYLVIVFCVVMVTGTMFAQDAELKEKFQKLNNEMIDAIIKYDVEEMVSKYTDDVISLPSYEPMIIGKKSLREGHKIGKESGVKMKDMTLNTIEVWSSGNLAVEIGTYTMEIVIPGMDVWNDNGKYVTIWEKQSDATWKVKAEIWNTDNNPWAEKEMAGDDEGQGKNKR